ncbi:MAG: LytTR family DNA-binding domain-containing protein [Gammaproteobacteria bacterium]|jgi:two-component system response regulator AlgR
MKVLIVDDEQLARDRLRALVNELGGYEVCATAANGIEALRQAETTHPDVVLMDIRMPGMDGIEAARHLTELEAPPALIFTTAYSQHALEAFETHATGYLLKPIRKAALEEALGKAARLTRAQLSSLSHEDIEDTPGARTHICARLRGRLELVPIEDILYFQADQKYVTVRHTGGEVIIEDSLRALEEEFGDHFLRIHRNALVGIRWVAGMEKGPNGGLLLTLRNDPTRLEISRRHAPAVRRYLKTH